MSFCGWSFMWGIIGSIRTETGTPALTRSWAALMRKEGDGAFGSMILAKNSLSVVMVNATVADPLLKQIVVSGDKVAFGYDLDPTVAIR